MLKLLNALIALLKPKNHTSLLAAQKSVVNGISTLKTTPPLLRVSREKTTTDAIFGRISFDDEFIGYSMERLTVAIPVGEFQGRKRYSQHFAMTVVGIDVPNRTDIEIHPANYPAQLLGCIAIGSSIDGDALGNSKAAFGRLMAALPDTFTVLVVTGF